MSGIARTFPSQGTLKSRYKRLHRFLDNSHFKIKDLSPALTHLAKGKEEGGFLPLAIDQTAIGDVQVLAGSYPIKARAIPIAMTTFEYGHIKKRGNYLEEGFLLVSCFSKKLLPTELVIDWYRARMNIETSFRDFKSLLGVRGISLRVRKAKRLNRLLAAVVLIYILLLALGVSELGKELRKELEIVRHRVRHGTKRTLSVLSLALMAITDPFLLNRLNLTKVLVDCLRKLKQNRVFISLLLG